MSVLLPRPACSPNGKAIPRHEPVSRADNLAVVHSVYQAFRDVRQLRSAWNDLAVRAGDLLCSFDWCELWWKYFGGGRQLGIHVLHVGHRLVAVLPLFRETICPAGVWLRIVRVVGCDAALGATGLAIEPAYAEQFTQMLLNRLDEQWTWDVLQMAPLRSYAVVAEPIAQSSARHPRVQAVIIGRHDGWDTLFHLPGTYEQFVTSIPTDARRDTPRRERRLRENHQVEVSTISSPEQLDPAMDALIQLHQKQWTGKGLCGHLGRPCVQQFHRDLARRLLGTGQLALLTLKVDGRIVAATYGYCFGDRTHHLIVGNSQDELLQRYALGKVMYGYRIRHAIAHGSRVLEDGRGIFWHKLDLGGKLYGGRSLVVVRRGRGVRLRFWLALRAAYLVHGLYSRIWLDRIVPRLGMRAQERPFYQRWRWLAQLFRQTHLRLFGGPILQETRCLEPLPASPARPVNP